MHVFEKNSDILTLLTEAVSEGVLIVNEEHEIVAANRLAHTQFGYNENELVGRPLDILIPEAYRKSHRVHVTEYYRQQKERRIVGRNLMGQKKNKEHFPVEVGLNPFSLNGNTYVMALVIDITERKLAEQKIGHLGRIFDESLNELYVFDAKSLLFTNANLGAQKNTGYVLQELEQLTPADLAPDFSEIELRKMIAPLLENSKDKIEFETVHRRKNGTTYPVEVHLQSSAIGEQKVIVAIILDISDRKDYTHKLEGMVAKRTAQLEKALEREKELNELKSRFLSLVSHEFKTPLSGILTSATLVGKYTTEEQQDKREKHLNTIMGGVYHLTNILDDFLSIERMEKGKESYNPTNFSVIKMVNEVVYNANLLLKDGQRINYSQRIDDITVRQDERIIALTLTNLLHNAIKYSPKDTEIDLTIRTYNNKLIFNVRDQGIGIPEKDQKHIFDRYFRAENILLTQGTGIGLNIVKTHLENLGGRIHFKSKEGEGSTFTVEVPIKKKRTIQEFP